MAYEFITPHDVDPAQVADHRVDPREVIGFDTFFDSRSPLSICEIPDETRKFLVADLRTRELSPSPQDSPFSVRVTPANTSEPLVTPGTASEESVEALREIAFCVSRAIDEPSTASVVNRGIDQADIPHIDVPVARSNKPIRGFGPIGGEPLAYYNGDLLPFSDLFDTRTGGLVRQEHRQLVKDSADSCANNTVFVGGPGVIHWRPTTLTSPNEALIKIDRTIE